MSYAKQEWSDEELIEIYKVANKCKPGYAIQITAEGFCNAMRAMVEEARKKNPLDPVSQNLYRELVRYGHRDFAFNVLAEDGQHSLQGVQRGKDFFVAYMHKGSVIQLHAASEKLTATQAAALMFKPDHFFNEVRGAEVTVSTHSLIHLDKALVNQGNISTYDSLVKGDGCLSTLDYRRHAEVLHSWGLHYQIDSEL